MIGFFGFMIIVVLGMLLLVSGLNDGWLSGGRRPVDGGGPSAAQLERMESALASLEARLGHLEDQQRFLERLLAERPEPRALPEREVGGILFDTEKSSEEEEL